VKQSLENLEILNSITVVIKFQRAALKPVTSQSFAHVNVYIDYELMQSTKQTRNSTACPYINYRRSVLSLGVFTDGNHFSAFYNSVLY